MPEAPPCSATPVSGCGFQVESNESGRNDFQLSANLTTLADDVCLELI